MKFLTFVSCCKDPTTTTATSLVSRCHWLTGYSLPLACTLMFAPPPPSQMVQGMEVTHLLGLPFLRGLACKWAASVFGRRWQFWFHSMHPFRHAVSEASTPPCRSGVAADLPLKIPTHTHEMQNSPSKCIYLFFFFLTQNLLFVLCSPLFLGL